MFVEYMAVQNREEAEKLFEMYLKCPKEKTDSEKFKIVSNKEKNGYVFSLKNKKGKKEQHVWNISLKEKGACAKREKTSGYVYSIVWLVLFGLLCAGCMGSAVFFPGLRLFFIWVSLLFFLFFLYVVWVKIFRPGIALKICLIRML